MKSIKCELCEGVWIVEDKDLENQKVCPYCTTSLQGEVEFSDCDSLDKAIYSAIKRMGRDIFQKPRQLSAFMMDIAPGLKKEIRIFLKAFSEDYFGYIEKAFEQKIEEVEMTISKLHHLFVEEEGLSDCWAEILCRGLYGAILYTKGIEITRFANVKIDEFNIDSGEKKSIAHISKSVKNNNLIFFDVDLNCDMDIKNGILNNYTGRADSVTVPEGVVEIGTGAFSGNSTIRRVQLPNSLSTIRESAFARCIALNEIEFPNGLEEIGDWAFVSCISLLVINLPISLQKIGKYAFSKCSRLSNVSICKNVKNIIFSVFSECKELQKLFISRNTVVYKDGFGFNSDWPALIEFAKANNPSEYILVENWVEKKLTHIECHDFLLQNVFDSLTGTFMIPLGFTYITDHGLDFYRREIKKLVIPRSVRYIEDNVLKGIDKLNDIILEPLNFYFFIADGKLYERKSGRQLWP